MRPRNEEISLIVIHNISLPPGDFGTESIERFFTNSLDASEHPFFAAIQHLRVAAHILIRRDGRIIQFVPFNMRAWHAGFSYYKGRPQCNDFSIGIEMEGTDSVPFEHIQYLQLSEVLNALWNSYSGICSSAIAAHSEIAPARKTDPGPMFDWSRIARHGS
jgi:AmpD protein